MTNKLDKPIKRKCGYCGSVVMCTHVDYDCTVDRKTQENIDLYFCSKCHPLYLRDGAEEYESEMRNNWRLP